jgi:hypothetical protein
MYTKLGFNLDESLIGKEGECFFDYLHLPMSVTMNDDKFTQQYFIDMMVRSDFKQTDVDDPTGIYEIGLPKKESEDGGKSSALQKEMVTLANILRKIKVFGTSIQFPQDEWENIKDLPFAKKRIFINKPRSQQIFSRKLSTKPDLVEPLLDEIVREFDKVKRHYMRSKGIDVPPTPTAQLEVMPPEEEIILVDTVSDAVPAPTETRKKTTEKQLITMSMLPKRTTRKTTSKRKTPTSKHKTPTSKRKTPTSKRKTPTSKHKTPTSKRKYDMRTLRTYNTRKRTQATQAGL